MKRILLFGLIFTVIASAEDYKMPSAMIMLKDNAPIKLIGEQFNGLTLLNTFKEKDRTIRFARIFYIITAVDVENNSVKGYYTGDYQVEKDGGFLVYMAAQSNVKTTEDISTKNLPTIEGPLDPAFYPSYKITFHESDENKLQLSKLAEIFNNDTFVKLRNIGFIPTQDMIDELGIILGVLNCHSPQECEILTESIRENEKDWIGSLAPNTSIGQTGRENGG